MSRPAKNRPLNPRRIGVIAGHTFTQLVRMKIFYFLGIFAVIILASNLFNIQGLGRPDLEGIDVLRMIRGTSLGTMTLFSVVIGVVATALLLPKDVEDRTLYTILAKPVPRLDYLLGKLAGVMLLIFVSLVVMDLLMTGVLSLRTNMVIGEQAPRIANLSQTERDAFLAEIRAQGATWSLHGATLAVFFRAAVISSMALLLSTVSTSTLFTTITSFVIFFIGNFQADAREFFLSSGDGITLPARLLGLGVAVIFPDFQQFNVIDAVIEGQTLLGMDLVALGGIALFYVVLHSFVSWLVFAGKEF
ncbi:ABC transporter permease [Haloferula sp. BvORR071]|uniref:ABC transporter permease n=1 Tax=Haloferula sp. BvORR071 TaxID=1396141 RepID=UPI0005587703|nr:ABC transporter permease [Haloferula sp. BvORR071]